MTAHDEVGARLEMAIRASRDGGDAALRRFTARTFDVEHKRDGSFVTIADREAEAIIRETVLGSFPDDAVLGEEHGASEGESGYRWIVDPIDGTASFVHGVPLWGTLVGVEHGGEIVAGVIHMPALDETVYAGRGSGAWHRVCGAAATPARVTDTDRVSEALIITTGLEYFSDDRAREGFLDLARACKRVRGWSDCYGFLLAATGRADAIVEPELKVWDAAPMPVIFAEAGGRYSGWDGSPSAHSPNGVASNGRVHDEILSIIGGR